MIAPTTGADFDRAYSKPITMWGDLRIPEEIKALVRHGHASRVLELGCGLGRFSRHLAQRGLDVTAVDFSRVAVKQAQERAANDTNRADYRVGDVTNLQDLTGPYDVSFDVGCFHCLDRAGQSKYAAEVHRLLKPGGTHLIWALDGAPADLTLSPAAMKSVFEPTFELRDTQKSRRRIIASHWYWLVRR